MALRIGLSGSKSSEYSSASDNKKGTATVVTTAGTKVGDKVVLTVIDPATAVTANTTLTVVDASAVSVVTIGDIYNVNGKVLSEDTMATEAFYLPITAKDQYGTALSASTADVNKANAGLLVLTSNSAVNKITDETTAIVPITIAGVDTLAIKLEPVAKGSAVITAVVTANGSNASKTITVAEGTKVDTAVIGAPEGTITGSSTIKIPVDLTNNKGVAVTKLSDIDANTKPGVTQNGSTITSSFIEENGQIFIKTTTAAVTTGTQNLLATVTTGTGKLASKVFTVKVDAVPTALVSLDAAVSRSLLQGQNLTIANKSFVVEDQYGNTITDTTKYEIAGAPVDGTKGITVDNTATGSVTVQASATATADTVTYTLWNAAGVTKSTIDVKYTTVQASQFTSYKVDNFGTIYAPATPNAAYSQQLKVYGVTAAGLQVLLPADTGLYTVATNTDYLTHDSSAVKGMLTGVATNLDNDVTTTTKPDTKDVTATVTINATGGNLTATGKVTVIKPVISTIQAVTLNTATGADFQTKALTAVTAATFAGAKEFNGAELVALADFVATDQYGVRVALDKADNTFTLQGTATKIPATLTFTPVTGTFTFDANGTAGAKVLANTANAVFNTRLSANGVNSDVSVTATAAYSAATAAKALTSFTPIAPVDGGTQIVPTYATAAAAVAALPTSISVTLGDASVVTVPITWSATSTPAYATTTGSYTFTSAWGTLPAGVNNSKAITAPTAVVTISNVAITATNSIANATKSVLDVSLSSAVAGLVKADFAVTKGGAPYTDFTVDFTVGGNYALALGTPAAAGDVFTVTITKTGYTFTGTSVTNNVAVPVVATNTIANATPNRIAVALDTAVAGLLNTDFAVTKAGVSYTNFVVSQIAPNNYVLIMNDAAIWGDVYTVTTTKAGYAFTGTSVTNNVAKSNIATVTSTTYSISTGGTPSETIINVPASTSVDCQVKLTHFFV